MKNFKQELIERNEKAKIASIRSLVAIVCIAVGILVSAQLHTVPKSVTNPVAPYTSLKDTKDELNREQSQLKAQILDLQKNIETAQNDSKNNILTKDEQSELNQQKALAGLTKLTGPGLTITLDDTQNGIVSDESIVHAADLRDVVALLWAQGAEAISINGQRVVLNTAIDCIVNTIMVNNVKLASPFKIEVIGNQKQLYDTITSPANLLDIYNRKKTNGLVFEVAKNNNINLPMFDGTYNTKVGN